MTAYTSVSLKQDGMSLEIGPADHTTLGTVIEFRFSASPKDMGEVIIMDPCRASEFLEKVASIVGQHIQ